MSRYTSSTARVREAAAIRRAQLEQEVRERTRMSIDELKRVQDTLLEGVGSRAVLDVEQRVAELARNGAPIADAQAMLGGLSSSPLFGSVADASSLTSMRGELTHVSQQLAVGERLVVARAVESSLQEMYASVERVDIDGAVGFEARRDHEVVVVGVQDGGTVTTDFINAPDCAASQRDLDERIRAKGIDQSPTEHVSHDGDGGSLVKAARSVRETSLAAGVAQHLRPRAASGWKPPSASMTTGQRIAR